MVNGQCLTTMVTTSLRSSGQDMGFGGLGMTNSKSGDYNLFSSGKVLELLRWPQCWFHKIRDLCHVQLHPTWFDPTPECRSWPLVSYLYSGHLPAGLYLGRGSLLPVGPLFHFHQCHSGKVSSRNEHVCPSSLSDQSLLGLHIVTDFWYRYQYWYHISIPISIRSISRYPRNHMVCLKLFPRKWTSTK